ncbi:SCY1-like protein 2 isoform X1 [Porites lutea]|uniref:SCY1-like protein 2 isoform X1 n=1 Tax=Porites lutea TaxID=51062 RepID=UPI003CC5E519
MDLNKVTTYSAAVFDRIKSAAKSATVTAVSATVSAVGAVGSLIGNPLTKDFDVGRHVASFGPNLAWKIYEGKKKTTGQEVSLVVLEKKLLDRVDKRDRDLVMDTMKKGPVQLTRLRHPRVLVVQHPLEESKDCLAFATEPIFASLANILGKHDNMPSQISPEFKTFELYDVERVYGLYQLVEGLTFLHNDAKILQGSLAPEMIVITKNGQWKIAGLFFSSTPVVIDGQSMYNAGQWEPRLWPWAQPDLNYAAPEYILSRSCDVSSDMFSLGVLIHSIYNKGRPPFDCDNNMTAFKRNVEQMSKNSVTALGNVPKDVQQHVRDLLSITPSLRPDVHQMSKISFFENVAAMTLQYLDSLVQRDEMAKSQFFRGLYKVMSKLPKRVVIQRVLPQLCAEFSNHQMVPFVLPNVLLIAEDCTTQEFSDLILPELKPVFKIQEPIQVVIIFLKKMDLLLAKTPKDDVRDHVLPMVCKALETPAEQLQEMVLSIIPSFSNMIEYSAMKNSIIPRIKNLCLHTTSLTIRVNALVCLGKMLENLDKYAVLDDIIPLMNQIPSREPPTLMAILGIFKQTMIHKKLGMDKDYLATKAIPFLFPLAVEPGLNLSQFGQYMKLINEMVRRVETEHRTKLEQLNKMQEQTKTSLKFAQEVQEAKAMDDLMGKIENLMTGGTPDAERTDKVSASTSSRSMGATNSAEFNRTFGLPENPSRSKGASLNGNLLGVDEFAMLQPTKQPSQDIQSNKPTQKFSPQKTLASSSSFSVPSRPMAASSFSQSGTSSFGSSMAMSSTPSYGMAGLNTGNTGMGSGMTGYTGMSGMNPGMSGLSMYGMNSGTSGLSGLNSGSMGMNPAGSTPKYSATGSFAGSQSKNAGGSSALDSLFAPELGHLQIKSKPSMSALQAQQGQHGGMNQGSMGSRPMIPQQYGGGMMTSSSGMFPMQQQQPIGGMSGQQYLYQSPPNQSSTNSGNDLKDLFG